MSLCHNCKAYKLGEWSAHGDCTNPPMVWVDVSKLPGDKQAEVGAKVLELLKQEKGIVAVAKTDWHNCGAYPVQYDPGIVRACGNQSPGKPEGKVGELLPALLMVTRGPVAVLRLEPKGAGA